VNINVKKDSEKSTEKKCSNVTGEENGQWIRFFNARMSMNVLWHWMIAIANMVFAKTQKVLGVAAVLRALMVMARPALKSMNVTMAHTVVMKMLIVKILLVVTCVNVKLVSLDLANPVPMKMNVVTHHSVLVKICNVLTHLGQPNVFAKLVISKMGIHAIQQQYAVHVRQRTVVLMLNVLLLVKTHNVFVKMDIREMVNNVRI